MIIDNEECESCESELVLDELICAKNDTFTERVLNKKPTRYRKLCQKVFFSIASYVRVRFIRRSMRVSSD